MSVLRLQCPTSSHQDTLASANWMFCQRHWSLPVWAPMPTAGAQCWGHQCVQCDTSSARWCQFCWLLLFPMSPKCFIIQLFLLKRFFLKAWSVGAGPGPTQRARSWNPFRITHPLGHLAVVPWIRYRCFDHLFEQKQSLRKPWVPHWKWTHARPVLPVTQIFIHRICEHSSASAEIRFTQLHPSDLQLPRLC